MVASCWSGKVSLLIFKALSIIIIRLREVYKYKIIFCLQGGPSSFYRENSYYLEQLCSSRFRHLHWAWFFSWGSHCWREDFFHASLSCCFPSQKTLRITANIQFRSKTYIGAECVLLIEGCAWGWACSWICCYCFAGKWGSLSWSFLSWNQGR